MILKRINMLYTMKDYALMLNRTTRFQFEIMGSLLGGVGNKRYYLIQGLVIKQCRKRRIMDACKCQDDLFHEFSQISLQRDRQ